MSSCESLAEHRGPHGPLERPPPEDRDLRLARVRRSPRSVVGIVRHRAEAGDRRSRARASRGGRVAILDEGFKQPAGETVLIQSDSLQASDPAFDAAIRAVVGRARRARTT